MQPQDQNSDQNQIAKIAAAIKLLIASYDASGSLLICGNGGSAANANHIANDLGHLRSKKYKHGFSAYSLVANESLFSCYANDYGYQNVFSKQLENHAKKKRFINYLIL